MGINGFGAAISVPVDIMDVEVFLKRLHDQIHVSGASGNATGRNVHQKSLKDAIAMCDAIYAITVENVDVKEALKIYRLN